MVARIVDGLTMFGVTLDAFWRLEKLALQLARRGAFVPPLASVAEDADPALAYVNPLPDGSVRWIADCPACRARGRVVAQYVWLATPLLFCFRCGNAEVEGKWRPITVPAERVEIERLLLLRPDPEQRAWTPGETLADLRVQNAELGIRGD